MASSSFDIVSKVDRREVDNALNRAAKEVTQRYDFKGVGASIEWSGDNVVIKANSADRVPAVLDVFESKLIRRGVSLKNIDFGEKEPQVSGKEYVLSGPTKEGIDRDNAKKISKIIRDEGPKGIKPQIQGRRAARDGQVARRAPGGHLAAQGQGPRRGAAVRQLPLTDDEPAVATSWSPRPVRRSG
uniref:Nucleotide-binding protein n=1 Tax=Janibacter limosus TaxID=53458 RepID=A0AC61U5S4_9MICO|nr:nucleotide-binding protein [Janibacter limosus]